MAKIPSYVIGVGLTKFIKPRGLVDYPELGLEAGVKAMLDTGINYDQVDQGIACYCYGDSTCGQRVFYQFGMTQIPIYNVNNNCATGSTGLFIASQLISGGLADCVLVVGFEKMAPGSLKSAYSDRAPPNERTVKMIAATHGYDKNVPRAPQTFGNAGCEYMEKFGATLEDFAEIARVNHEHSAKNPYSQFRDVYTLEEIMKSPMIHYPLTKLQCCPTSDGGAAAVVVSQKFLEAHPELKPQAIAIAGCAMATDSPRLYSTSAIDLVGFEMTKRASKEAMAQAGITPKMVKVCELHDCFSANEMITIDGLGLCESGKAHQFVREGNITFGGRVVVNPSGGLISKGHPLGATGLAQCAELCWQLRGWATNRLVPGASVALQHNLGLGGAAVVTVYKRADGQSNTPITDVSTVSRMGYNPAVEARPVTDADIVKVRSDRNHSTWMDVEAIVMVEAGGSPGAAYWPLETVDVPFPKPLPGEVVVRISCASLNHRDLFARQRLYRGATPGVPIMADAVGVVVSAAAEEIKKQWLGKRVLLAPARGWKCDPAGPESAFSILGGTVNLKNGCCQEYIAVPAAEIELCPVHLSDQEAAAIPLAALTAWRATFVKAEVKPGQNVFITGIGGGVALFCLQFALARGAVVYVSSGSEDKLSKAKALGATAGVNYKDSKWSEQLKDLLPPERPYLDAIIDGAGGDIVSRSLHLLKAGGIISSYGMTLGPKVTFSMSAVMRNIELRGSTMGSREEFRKMVEYVSEKRIKPVVDSVHAFENVEDAFTLMKERKNFGKLVIEILSGRGSPKL
ncbi:Thiolase, domain-containing protein [Cladophialophora immunda]|nr:Thiolase, domain-containing protein [Cladophialophora immunda]